jgi:hypothetical protein
MCHGYHPEWDSARKTAYDDEGDEETPSFLAEDSSTDTELLTDGGDEDEEEA